jgi:hypothetical protein
MLGTVVSTVSEHALTLAIIGTVLGVGERSDGNVDGHLPLAAEPQINTR